MVSTTDPYDSILGFVRLEPLLFLPSSSSIVLTRLSGPRSKTHYFSENLVAPGIEPGTSGSIARNSDHYITEVVLYILETYHKISACSSI
jgi:hypothetical protein